MPENRETQKNNRKAGLPLVGQKVLVQCEGFRGLAYRNSGGQWKAAADNRNLPKHIEILSLK